MTTLRALAIDDWSGVNALHRSVAWGERSEAGWRWLLSNPAAAAQPDRPTGWVIDGDAGPVAFVGNFLQTVWVDQTAHPVASGFSIIVSPAARGESRRLIRAFLDQAGIAAAYTFNANPLSAPLLGRFGMTPWPDRTSALKLTWTIDPIVQAWGRVNRMLDRRRAPSRPMRERLMNRRLARPVPLLLPDGVIPLDDFSDSSAFADFWNRLKARPGALMDRSPATLRWRLTDPDQAVRPLILAHCSRSNIDGYVWAMPNKDEPGAAPALDVIDLVALNDDPAVLRTLMGAVLANARGAGAAKVRMQVVNPVLLDALGDLTRRARREGWGHCHVRFDDATASPLKAGWRPTPFDGDYSLCLRPVPLSGADRL